MKMKKVFALLLALVMLAAAGTACAETLAFEPGTPSACTPEMFKLYFALIAGQSGYNFVWEDDIGTDGAYAVYTGHSEDGLMSLNIYAMNGGVVYSEAIGTATISDAESAEKFGEWFGAAVGGSVIAFYIGENGAESLDASVTNKFTNDLMGLVAFLQNGSTTDEQLAEGMVYTTTCLDYPTGMEISGSADGSGVTMALRILVSTKDGQMSIK